MTSNSNWVPAAVGYLYPKSVQDINVSRVLIGSSPLGSVNNYPIPTPISNSLQYVKTGSGIKVGRITFPRSRPYVGSTIEFTAASVNFIPVPSYSWHNYFYNLRNKTPSENPRSVVSYAFSKMVSPLTLLKSKTGRSRVRITFGSKRYRECKLLRGNSFKVAVNTLLNPTPAISVLRKKQKVILRNN